MAEGTFVTAGPLVSVIIPTYNRAHIVPEAIASVLRQTYSNIEVIVVDDGSTDKTPQCLQQFGDRIIIIRQENAGPAAARNRGISIARGELIAFLDSDDIWLPTKLERQVLLMEKAGDSVPCCICNIRMQWTDRELCSFDIAALNPGLEEGIWLNVSDVLSTRFLLFNQGAVIRRDILHKIGGFDESLRLLEDHELALRLSTQGPWGFVREPLVVWRESRAGSLYQSVKNDEVRQIEPLIKIMERHLARVHPDSSEKKAGRLLARELKRNARRLRALKMTVGNSVALSYVGISLQWFERCRRALFIRSPWFPKMKVSTVS